VHQAGCVQISECPEKRSHGRNRLSGGELSPRPDQLSERATVRPVDHQSQRPIVQSDNGMLRRQMLAPDPFVHGEMPGRQAQGS